MSVKICPPEDSIPTSVTGKFTKYVLYCSIRNILHKTRLPEHFIEGKAREKSSAGKQTAPDWNWKQQIAFGAEFVGKRQGSCRGAYYVSNDEYMTHTHTHTVIISVFSSLQQNITRDVGIYQTVSDGTPLTNATILQRVYRTESAPSAVLVD